MEATIKQLAKKAKKRIKSGYWTKSREELEKELERAKINGVNESKVVEFYRDKAKGDIYRNEENDVFYLRVKEILDKYGEVSDILGRLADKDYLATLPYEQKQRYYFDLSEKYRTALAKYKKEKELFKDNI